MGEVAVELNMLGKGDLDVSLLGVTPVEPENIPVVEDDSAVPNILLLEGVCVDALLMEGAGFEPNELPLRESVIF